MMQHQDSKDDRSGFARWSNLLWAVAAFCLVVPFASGDLLIDHSLPNQLTIGDLPDGLEHANHGAFEGGPTGTDADAGINQQIPEDQLDGGGGFDLPTGGKPSPLFGATSWSQKMLRFEEFARCDMPTSYGSQPAMSFPSMPDAGSCPNPIEMDDFLDQQLWPAPTRMSNTTLENPLKSHVETFLNRTLEHAPCEGRPGGEGWAHQRYDEFPPQMYFQAAMTGARLNTGRRNADQLHGFTTGEWGPGGLYHHWSGAGDSSGSGGGSNDAVNVQFHPNMPVQNPLALWTFDGTFPPKLLMARYGESILFRHYNGLPIDPSANMGFGLHTITTHEHNGHNPAESDGYASAFFFPGQFYDYRWPMIVAGHDSINTTATDPRMGRPEADGSSTNLPGDYQEVMSTHWFHDHMLDFTAQNVYKGNAAMMNYYSALDRGNEAINDGVNLRLPSGTALGWGNRDYDVNLVIADKAWTQSGQLWFNIFNLDGFMGDKLLTNWQYNPYLDVRARRYRFRILNGSVSRYLKIGLVDQNGTPVPFHMVANDGNIMDHTVKFDGSLGTTNAVLPTQGIAERYDIIIDFSNFQQGDKLYFVNTLEHQNGKKPNDIISLSDILSGQYQAVAEDDDGDGVADRWRDGDPCVGKFLEFRVHDYTGTDLSIDPSDYEEGGQVLLPRRVNTADELANARHRTFSFGRSSGTDSAPWTVKTDGGDGHTADMRRLSAAPTKGDLEIWHIENGGGGWSHPVHVHFEEGQVLSRGGEAPPQWEKYARKDVYRIGSTPDSTDSVEIAIRFREFMGTYMEHCHNTQHEDHAMLLRWDIENPGQTLLIPNPIPTWEGVEYADTVALPTFRLGDGYGPSETSVAEALGGSGGGGNSGPSSATTVSAVQVTNGVSLAWTNPPLSDSIAIERDGAPLATLAGTATSFIDGTVEPGAVTYEVITIVGGASSTPSASAVTVRPAPISSLACVPGVGVVDLSWTLGQAYDSITVIRNGVTITTLAGTAEAFQDTTAPAGGNVYAIVARTNLVDSDAVSCTQGFGVAGIASFNCSGFGTFGDLFWSNSATYSQITVERDGVLLAAIPGSATSYFDTALPFGTHVYTLTASTATETLPAVSCSVTVAPPLDPITGLSCSLADACGTTIATWTNNGFYDTIVITVDGVLNFIATGNSVLETIVLPGPGIHTITFTSMTQEIPNTPSSCTVEVLESSTLAPTNLLASTDLDTCEATLAWTPQGAYSSFLLTIDGSPFAELPGTDTGAIFTLPANGTHEVCLIATSECGVPLPGICATVNCSAAFSRGDANADGQRNVGDTIYTLNMVFGFGVFPSCADAADSNDDGSLDISDAIHGLFSLFGQGPPPSAPFPGCGNDPSSDGLVCPSYTPCP